MRKLYYFLLQTYQKLKIQGFIREMDSKSPVQTSKIDSPLSKNGWSVMPSDDLFGESISNYIYNGLSFSRITFDSYGNWVSREIPAEVIEKIACNPKIQKVVTEYLGSGARLDDAYFWFKCGSPRKKSISEEWHDDNVGHRLKLFICLEAGPRAPRTFVISESNRRLYRFSFVSEMRRYLPVLSVSKQNRPHVNMQEIIYEKDSIICFDTNLKHRGDYEGRPDKRDCLIVEFMDRTKSDTIAGLAPCGPGQSREGRILIVGDSIRNLADSPMIDHNLLKSCGVNNYSYSLSNRNST